MLDYTHVTSCIVFTVLCFSLMDVFLYYRELLGHLSDEQFEKLERALCSAEGLGTLNRSKKDSKQKTTTDGDKTESPSEENSDASTSTPFSDPPVPSASSPERVFEPRPPQSNKEGSNKEGR